MAVHRTITQKGNNIYLLVNGQWYYYDATVQPVGEGAMGVVYYGFSYDRSERVAIKRIREEYANLENIRSRAMMEASLMFRHSNLVEMIGYCSLYPDRGPIYIVSRFVPGITIDKFVLQLNNSPQRVPRICQMMYPVLDALEYIHSKNIIHMDIKPSNIMVENGCNVRLMDLGIAYVEDHLTASESTYSALIGTPKYAAPEQFGVSGRSVQLNSSTDIFEAGITLYELLTGFNPFSARNLNEAITKRQNVVLPYVESVPQPIVDVLRKATAYRQSDRYESVREFKTALNAAVSKPAKKAVPAVLIAVLCSGFVTLLLIIIFILIQWNS